MKPPYVAVIFSSELCGDHLATYNKAAERMESLAAQQPGYLGFESVHGGMTGISISYWEDEAAAHAWGQHPEHREVQRQGKDVWYSSFRLRVCAVTRDYDWEKQDP